MVVRYLKIRLQKLLYGVDRMCVPDVDSCCGPAHFDEQFMLGQAQHKLFVEMCGTTATIDVGHTHTINSVKEFLQAEFQVAYYHLSDNDGRRDQHLSLIHISEPTRRTPISYAVFCLK